MAKPWLRFHLRRVVRYERARRQPSGVGRFSKLAFFCPSSSSLALPCDFVRYFLLEAGLRHTSNCILSSSRLWWKFQPEINGLSLASRIDASLSPKTYSSLLPPLSRYRNPLYYRREGNGKGYNFDKRTRKRFLRSGFMAKKEGKEKTGRFYASAPTRTHLYYLAALRNNRWQRYSSHDQGISFRSPRWRNSDSGARMPLSAFFPAPRELLLSASRLSTFLLVTRTVLSTSFIECKHEFPISLARQVKLASENNLYNWQRRSIGGTSTDPPL